jgi:predicted phosphoribosyltransferase
VRSTISFAHYVAGSAKVSAQKLLRAAPFFPVEPAFRGCGFAAPNRMPSGYRDRIEAGRALAQHLLKYADRTDVIVLALPRGGVPVAYQVARRLRAPLDVFLVRKLGVPGHEELAMGAIASGGVRVLNDEVVRMLSIPPRVIDAVAQLELAELQRREALYRGDRPAPQVAGETVILIDDGLATGSTMRAAAAALRRENPAKLIVAVPVAAAETCEAFRDVVDEVVCATTPAPFHAVGVWYGDFSQTTDDEVRDLLARASREHAAESSDTSRSTAPATGT